MEIVMKDYNLDHFQTKDVYTWDEIIEIIENLESELHIKEEELENLEQNLKDNYRPIPYAEQVGISDRDFI